MAGHADFSTALITSTLQKFRRTLSDNVTGNQALFAQMKSMGFFREDDGGRTIVEPLLYGTNSTVGSYSGYDLLDVTPQEGITAAEYQWKQIAGTVSISGEEEFKNSGSRERILNLLEAKIRQLEISMQLELNTQLFGDGTGNSGKDITGLDLAVEDGAAWATYGGIDSSDASNAWWRNQYLDFDGTYTSFQTAKGQSFEGIYAIRNVINSASRGKDRPTLLVTTQTVYEQYLSVLENKRRFTDGKLGDLGFKNVLFDDIPMVWDEDAGAEDLFVLNARYLRFVIGRGRNFVATPFVTPANQDAKVSKVLLYANLTCSNRARQGRMIDLVAT